MTEIDPKLSRIYREASTEGPPPALDAAVLAAARKQVAKPQRRERSSWVRWMAPASAIAILVLGVSIALLVEREQPETTDSTVIREMPPRPQSAPPARITESAKPKSADSAAPAGAAKIEAPAATDRAAPGTAIKKEAQTPAPAAPAQAPVPRPAEAVPPAAQAFPAESRAKAAESKVTAPKAAESTMSRESDVAGDSALGGAGAAAPAAPAAAGRLAPMRQQAIQRSPEAWLDEISRLKREGRDKEAAEQLVQFRKAYPAYALPEYLSK